MSEPTFDVTGQTITPEQIAAVYKQASGDGSTLTINPDVMHTTSVALNTHNDFTSGEQFLAKVKCAQLFDQLELTGETINDLQVVALLVHAVERAKRGDDVMLELTGVCRDALPGSTYWTPIDSGWGEHNPVSDAARKHARGICAGIINGIRGKSAAPDPSTWSLLS